MRRLFILPVVLVLLLLAATPVAAVDPPLLGPNASAGATGVPSSGTDASTNPVNGTAFEPVGVDGTSVRIVSDEVLRLHRTKGAPVALPTLSSGTRGA